MSDEEILRDSGLNEAIKTSTFYPILVEAAKHAFDSSRFEMGPAGELMMRSVAVAVEEYVRLMCKEVIKAALVSDDASEDRIARKVLVGLLRELPKAPLT